MPLDVHLIDMNGNDLHTEEYTLYGKELHALALLTPQKAHGRFKTVGFTVQATAIMAQPESGGSIELTDMIATFEKKNLGVVTIRFYDGTNEALIAKATLTDGPFNGVASFVGRWRGWANAYVDATVSGADTIGMVAIGYVKHQKLGTQSYEEWTGDR